MLQRKELETVTVLFVNDGCTKALTRTDSVWLSMDVAKKSNENMRCIVAWNMLCNRCSAELEFGHAPNKQTNSLTNETHLHISHWYNNRNC